MKWENCDINVIDSQQTNYVIIPYFFVISWLQTNVNKNDHLII